MIRGGVSVIITCYNDGAFLKEATASAKRMIDRIGGEVIIVDDHSSDELTRRALSEIETYDSCRVICKKGRSGVQTSRSLGQSEAQYDYLTFLDADDMFLDEEFEGRSFLEFSLERLRSDPDVAFVHGLSMMFGSYEGPTISCYPLSEELVVSKHHVPTSIVARSDDCFSRDTRIQKWQDWDFGVHLLAERAAHGRSNKIELFPSFCHGYRIHSERPRLSSRTVDEFDSTRMTINRHLGYFKKFYEGEEFEITRQVIARKPNRLVEILHVAAWNLPLAQSIALGRDADLTGEFLKLGIP